ncbi:MAG: hypothetical protein LH702_04070, partial [Phormidesmis sp. CAN_BIN44]|nr:hypothetical protein [Phormidesmis sp. CAN_BIN44]
MGERDAGFPFVNPAYGDERSHYAPYLIPRRSTILIHSFRIMNSLACHPNDSGQRLPIAFELRKQFETVRCNSVVGRLIT